MRSTARWVLPVLVGPRMAVRGARAKSLILPKSGGKRFVAMTWVGATRQPERPTRHPGESRDLRGGSCGAGGTRCKPASRLLSRRSGIRRDDGEGAGRRNGAVGVAGAKHKP